jgi:hypothetical protein
MSASKQRQRLRLLALAQARSLGCDCQATVQIVVLAIGGHCARQAASWIVEYFDGSVHQPASPHAGSTNVGPQLPV